jgi:hypothetical protein
LTQHSKLSQQLVHDFKQYLLTMQRRRGTMKSRQLLAATTAAAAAADLSHQDAGGA